MSLNNLMVLEALEVPSGSNKCGSESPACHFAFHLASGVVVCLCVNWDALLASPGANSTNKMTQVKGLAQCLLQGTVPSLKWDKGVLSKSPL